MVLTRDDAAAGSTCTLPRTVGGPETRRDGVEERQRRGGRGCLSECTRTPCRSVAEMSPVVDCDIKEETDSQLLVLPVSPFSEDENVEEVVCPASPGVNHLSNSFPSCSLSMALRDVQPDDVKVETLSMSCFADLKLDKFADDDDLTSLDWLQDINLLRNISPDRQHCSDPSLDGSQKENTLSPYHPKHNPCGKPPYSFSVLIFMAIESSPQRRLPVKGIYQWIADQFPFYRRAPLGWHNSVRHNLSLNKCFCKVEKALGKGSSWCVDPLFRPNLLQAMRRTPYFPFQQIQMTSVAAAEVFQDDDAAALMDLNDEECETSSNELLPYLLPFNSRRRQRTSEVDMDVAATLASLGNARSSATLSDRERKLLKIRSVESLPELVCTPQPSKDHTYGFTERLVVEAQQAALAIECDVESPVDEVYDFGEIYCDSEVSSSDSDEALTDMDSESSRSPQRHVISRRSWMKSEDDIYDEEQRRLEGVRALLNLASGTKVDKKKSRRLPVSGSQWAKAVSTCLKKQNKRPRKVLRKKANNSKVKNNKRNVVIKRRR